LRDRKEREEHRSEKKRRGEERREGKSGGEERTEVYLCRCTNQYLNFPIKFIPRFSTSIFYVQPKINYFRN